MMEPGCKLGAALGDSVPAPTWDVTLRQPLAAPPGEGLSLPGRSHEPSAGNGAVAGLQWGRARHVGQEWKAEDPGWWAQGGLL